MNNPNPEKPPFLNNRAMGRPYSLALDPFSALVLFLSVTHAHATSADGASNWLLGVQLIGTYILIALPFLYMRD